MSSRYDTQPPLIMRLLLGQVVLLLAVCYGLDEKDIPEHLRKNFDGNKLILPVTREYGEEFYASMTTKAFTAVLRSMARERGGNAQSSLRNDKVEGGNSLKHADGRIRQLNGFLAQGVKLVAAATGNVVGNKNVRLLSPRIGNTKRADKEVSLLSPEISLSTDSNNTDSERNALLELLLEVSGATAGMRKALNRMKSEIPQMTKDDVEKTIGKRERQKIE
ncbi:hypothetical protein TELCIR_13050, partial [Teladorsagia circumcincta]